MQAYLYLTDTDHGCHFDPKNILIMGDSAGGGLSLALMLYIRDHGLPQPEGAVLLSVCKGHCIVLSNRIEKVYFHSLGLI